LIADASVEWSGINQLIDQGRNFCSSPFSLVPSLYIIIDTYLAKDCVNTFGRYLFKRLGIICSCFSGSPFPHVFANCSKLLLALGVVAVSSCCAGRLVTGNMGKRPGIVLTKLEEESRSSKGLYTASFHFMQPAMVRLSLAGW
jgi:hypothetical protein